MLLDSRLNFNENVQTKGNKCYTVIGFIKKLSIQLPREALLRIYKSFVRPHLDYDDLILINLIMNHLKVELKVFNIKHV